MPSHWLQMQGEPPRWHTPYQNHQSRNDVKPDDLLLLVTRTMPFGKYKDRLIADLPGHYLNWFARAGFPHGELGQLLALMHEIDHNGLSELLTPLRKSGARPPAADRDKRSFSR